MLSEVSPLSPIRSATSSGGDAVALDHPLAVVDLGVGDAARGGHHPDPVADELVDVAVAGDDHHRDAPPRARWRARVAITSSASQPSTLTLRKPNASASGARCGHCSEQQVGPRTGAAPCRARRSARGPTSRRPRRRSRPAGDGRSGSWPSSRRTRRSRWSGARRRSRSTPAARRTPGRRGCCRRSGTARRRSRRLRGFLRSPSSRHATDLMGRAWRLIAAWPARTRHRRSRQERRATCAPRPRPRSTTCRYVNRTTS